MKTQSHRDFLVYAHHKATTGQVFYIGKGDLARAHMKSGRSVLWKRTVAKHGLVVKIVQSGLQEWVAFELERDLVALHGRLDLGLGPLVNFTDGGDGVAGLIPSEKAIEARRKTMKTLLARPDFREKVVLAAKKTQADPGFAALRNERIRHMNADPAFRAKQVAGVKKWAAENSDVLSASGERFGEQGRKAFSKPVVCVENGRLFFSSMDAIRWLQSEGKAKASQAAIQGCVSGKRRSAYGYRWKFAQEVSA
jgi:hypothetical protein